MVRSIQVDDVRLRRRIDEDERLAALRSYEILDTTPEPRYERLAEMLRIGCGAAWAMITFVDSDRQWFKATHGCIETETPRSVSFCSVSMLQDEPLIVEDARLDPRFRHNALVTGAPYLRFYAGFPIFSQEGFGLGSVCVIDMKPRVLGEHELQLIRLGRDWVQASLESRRLARSMDEVLLKRDTRFMERRRHHDQIEIKKWQAVDRVFDTLNRA